jgi:hypothetical protein
MISDYMENLTYEAHDFGRNIYNKYIYKLGNRYHIRKSLNGETEYFGSYPTFEEARQIRDKLILNDWNKDCIQEILDEKDKVKDYYKYIRKNNRYYAIAGPYSQYMGQVNTIEEALYYRDIIFKNNLKEARPKDYDLITDNPYLKYGLEVPLPERLILNVQRTDYGKGHIERKGPQSYHVWYGSTYYYACPTYEMAYYMKQELNKVGWDKGKVPEIVDNYPVWYTWLNNFWKFVTPAQGGNGWRVNLTPRNTGYEKPEHVFYNSVENALWERDLLVKYGFDEDLVTELADDTLNPYFDMELPPYPQRKVRRIKEREPRTELFNTLFTLIQEEPELSQEEYCEIAGTTAVNFRNILQREFNTNWAEFKTLCESGEDPNEVLVQEPLIYNPDLTLHRTGTFIAKYDRLKSKYVVSRWENNRNHYYGAYPTKELAEKIIKDLEKCGWDKSKLKEIQARNGHVSMVGSKRWVYANKYPTKKGKKISSYSVRHKNKDKRMVNFGSYKDKRVAELVRDQLILCDWDKSQLDDIKSFAYYVIDQVDNCWRCQV